MARSITAKSRTSSSSSPPARTPGSSTSRPPPAPAAPGTPVPVPSPGTVDNPRVIELRVSDSMQWVDPASGSQITAISVVQGETVEFHVINQTAIGHNFHIGSATAPAAAPQKNDLPAAGPLGG